MINFLEHQQRQKIPDLSKIINKWDSSWYLMTITVTKMPGGVTQLFNTETGRVTYKCKAESAYMLIDAFGGIVKFTKKGAMATVTGHVTSLDSCIVIHKNESEYKDALSKIIQAHKEYAKIKAEFYAQEIKNLESQISSTV